MGEEVTLTLDEESEVLLPFPEAGLRPHSFAFFLVSHLDAVARPRH